MANDPFSDLFSGLGDFFSDLFGAPGGAVDTTFEWNPWENDGRIETPLRSRPASPPPTPPQGSVRQYLRQTVGPRITRTEPPAATAKKPASFTDYARGKSTVPANSGGAHASYEAALEAGLNPRFNQGPALGLDGSSLSTVQTKSGAKFSVASPAARQFKGFLDELEASGYRIKPETSGGYNDRNIRGTTRKSQHAFGSAIDVNWDENQFDGKGTNTLPPNVGKLAAKYGLSWGGYFKGRKKDTMHFEVSELLDVAELE